MLTKILFSSLIVFAAFAAGAVDNPTAMQPNKDAAEESTDVESGVVDSGSNDSTTYLICKNKEAVRTVRVHKKANGGCETTYTKEGVDKSVGNSWTMSRCSKVLGNIRSNLEKANWKCKDISEARVSSSEE